MDSPIIITNKIYKVMKYLYRHKEVSLQQLEDIFGENVYDQIHYLCRHRYAVYKGMDSQYTYDTSTMSFDGVAALAMEGEKYVEEKRSSFLRWLIPTTISIVALIVSFLALYASLLTQEVFVHLID